MRTQREFRDKWSPREEEYSVQEPQQREWEAKKPSVKDSGVRMEE